MVSSDPAPLSPAAPPHSAGRLGVKRAWVSPLELGESFISCSEEQRVKIASHSASPSFRRGLHGPPFPAQPRNAGEQRTCQQ